MIHRALADWRYAWQTRADNPLVEYFALAERRRREALPWYRQHLMALLSILACFAMVIIAAQNWHALSASPWSIPVALRILFMLSQGLLFGAIIWVGGATYDAVRDALTDATK